MNPALVNKNLKRATRKNVVNQRIAKVLVRLKKENLDGLIVSSSSNITYLTDYPSRDSYLLLSRKKNIYFTDSRYAQEAKKSLGHFCLIKEINGPPFQAIAGSCGSFGLKRIGFEESDLSFAFYSRIEELLGSDTDLIPTANLIERLRQIKSSEELEKMRKAIEITRLALEFIEKFIIPGKKEIEIAAELEHFVRYNGASSTSFDIIVASGPNSAYPHHITSERKVKEGEPVLIDLGVTFSGYKSDLTRVFFSGKINPLVRRVYNIVLRAQERAIKKIKPGVGIDRIDTAARQYITKQGYGGFFAHSLGHGVGLDIHESPSISAKTKSSLEAGMVFTVEPGIYLVNRFGIRIEDMVLVTNKGVEVLSGAINK